MNKITINVPNHVNYISDWIGFENEIPKGQVIINKKYPGCGLTYWALHNHLPIVLCVPRKYLAENKVEQMEEEGLSCFHFKPSTKSDKQKQKEENLRSFTNLRNYLTWYNDPFSPVVNVPKVIVTYDSLPTIYPILADSGIDFLYVVDEHQASFQDYSMKPEVIERVSSLLYTLRNVWYISATPILEGYLDRMDFLCGLPYVELVWSKDRILDVNTIYEPLTTTTVSKMTEIIKRYKKDGVFDTISENGIVYDSTEAVFFVNNVRDIVKTIKENKLKASEVNILVAHDSKNNKLIQSLGEGFGFGKIPTKGKPHCPYTFCSKCSYAGIDFYSLCASTYVFADSNIKSMCTDISLDLLQIVGRQRLAENLFRKKCTIYVKTTQGSIQSREEFYKEQEAKWKISEELCNEYNGLSQAGLAAMSVIRENCPYGVIYEDPFTGNRIAKNCINAKIAEEHAWEMRDRIYRSHSSVQSIIIRNGFEIMEQRNIPTPLVAFVENFRNIVSPNDKMRYYAEFFDANPNLFMYADSLSYIPANYKNYYITFGSDSLRNAYYDMSYFDSIYIDTLICNEVATVFIIGQSYSKKVIKDYLTGLYQKLRLPRKAKATDLDAFFNLTSTKGYDEYGKRVSAFTIKQKL